MYYAVRRKNCNTSRPPGPAGQLPLLCYKLLLPGRCGVLVLLRLGFAAGPPSFVSVVLISLISVFYYAVNSVSNENKCDDFCKIGR